MARLLPEVLGEIFRYLQASEGSTLDLVAASLVCTAWYYERLFSLLVESRRLGLDHCDLVEEMYFNLYWVTEEVRENVDVLFRILSLALPNLRGIQARLTNPQGYQESQRFQSDVIAIFDKLCPLACTITTLVAIGPSSYWPIDHRAIIHLINLLSERLRDVTLSDLHLSEPIQLALTQCSCIERLAARQSSFSPLSNQHCTVVSLANALSNLTSLTWLTANEKNKGIPASAVRMLVTLRPGLRELWLRVDASMDDDCLRLLAQSAGKMVNLYLEQCKGIKGTGTWTEEDIKWHGLRRLHIEGAMGISRSMVEQLLRGCDMLENVYLAEHSGFDEVMSEYGFECKKGNVWQRCALPNGVREM